MLNFPRVLKKQGPPLPSGKRIEKPLKLNDGIAS
jgi:hypothetical protein